MTLIIVTIAAALWLAWSNGANDNFKGMATIYGSNRASYRRTLTVATIATIAGVIVSLVFAAKLAAAFSGKGLVSEDILGPPLLASVATAGAATVFLATIVGMPTSTTHALTGALVGAALVSRPDSIAWSTLATKFGQPLFLSPFLALAITAGLYMVISPIRRRLGIDEESCVCVTPAQEVRTASGPVMRDGEAAIASAPQGSLAASLPVVTAGHCDEATSSRGLRASAIADGLHWLSGGAVCFARGVNDTPKIAALLIALGAAGLELGSAWILAMIGTAMVVGGLLQSRPVAETMSHDITDLNCGQGLTANLVTAGLVLGASRFGLPVSTTHVSCGAIFGISAATRRGRLRTILSILTTWVTTLPLALVLGATMMWLIGR